MADTAVWLIDRVLPFVPVRQWVLTLPFSLRFRMDYDAGLTPEVLRIFLRSVFSYLRILAAIQDRVVVRAPSKGGKPRGGHFLDRRFLLLSKCLTLIVRGRRANEEACILLASPPLLQDIHQTRLRATSFLAKEIVALSLPFSSQNG